MNEVITIGDKQFKPYISQQKIADCVKRLGSLINEELKNENPVFVVVLNGAFIFASDLLREITISCGVSFVKVASYSGNASGGVVHELIGLTEDLSGKTVVIVEDIVDSGLTLEKLMDILGKKNVKQIKVASAFFKPDAYKKEYKIDYPGIHIKNEFIVGYGLDYDGRGRNLKEIYISV